MALKSEIPRLSHLVIVISGSLLLGAFLLNPVEAKPAEQALKKAPPFAAVPADSADNALISSVIAGEFEVIRESEASLERNCPSDPSFGPLLLQVRMVYSTFGDFCGGPDAPACAGRLTVLQESCLGASGTTALAAQGLQASQVSQSTLTRICFDPMAQSDCTGAVPAAAVIAEGAVQSQGMQVIVQSTPTGAPQQFMRDANSETLPIDAVLDGRPVVVAAGRSRATSHGEVSAPDRCGLRGIAEALGGAPFQTRPCGLAVFTSGGSD